MALVKLTDKHYANPDLAGKVVYDVEYGLPHFEVRFRNGWEPINIYGTDAEEAWTNWTAHINTKPGAENPIPATTEPQC